MVFYSEFVFILRKQITFWRRIIPMTFLFLLFFWRKYTQTSLVRVDLFWQLSPVFFFTEVHPIDHSFTMTLATLSGYTHGCSTPFNFCLRKYTQTSLCGVDLFWQLSPIFLIFHGSTPNWSFLWDDFGNSLQSWSEAHHVVTHLSRFIVATLFYGLHSEVETLLEFIWFDNFLFVSLLYGNGLTMITDFSWWFRYSIFFFFKYIWMTVWCWCAQTNPFSILWKYSYLIIEANDLGNSFFSITISISQLHTRRSWFTIMVIFSQYSKWIIFSLSFLLFIVFIILLGRSD